MQILEPPDSFFVQAARSCLESGNHAAARQELEKVTPTLRSHPDVLEIRWVVEAQSAKWPLCLEIAQEIVRAAPERPTGWIKRSFVLHRLKRTQEALDSLFPAAEKFSNIPIIPYSLACYAAQLNLSWETERWLKQAIETGGADYREMALREKDLESLWPIIQEWRR